MAIARRSAHMNVMVEAAEKAARGLVRDFGEIENLQISKKGPGDFVSNADLKSESTIRAVLEKARPKYGFLMEESGITKGADEGYRWIVDPLDGTTNFLRGIPHWAIVIALEKEGEIVAGLIYDAVKDELFTAEKGTGAFINNRRLRVSPRTSLTESLIAVDSVEYNPKLAQFITDHATRCLGSAALDLAYIAAARLDGGIQLGMNPWDVGAGALIVKEAGGKVTDADGGNNFVYGRSLVAGSLGVQKELLKKLTATAAAKAS
jgi:myo-inositol-1(or 4)-monophosphatase